MNYSSNYNLDDFITNSEDPESVFDLMEKLGQGTYGSVYKAWNKISGSTVAAKIMSVEGDIDLIDSFKKEIKILENSRSPYILEYFGSYYKDNQIWLIIEYCDAGSVLDLMRIMKKPLNEQEIASIIENVLHALVFLHENKKIHRDLKSGNILLNHKGEVKLGDFGVSTQLMNSFSKKNSKIGTPYWMSPEVIQQNHHNQSTDIWSLGITCIEMAEGEPPNSNIKPMRAMMNIIKNPPKGLSNVSEWSNEFNDFVKKCLTLDPLRRPIARDLLNHEFIKIKSKGPPLISELVANNLNEINQYRLTNFLTESENEKGTIISKCKSSINVILGDECQGTMLVRDEIDKNTFVNNNSLKIFNSSKKDKEKDQENLPLFMRFYNEKDISYDEEIKESDLFENRKQGKKDLLDNINLINSKNDCCDNLNTNEKICYQINNNRIERANSRQMYSSNFFNKKLTINNESSTNNSNFMSAKQNSLIRSQNQEKSIPKSSINNNISTTPRNNLENELKIKPKDLIGSKETVRKVKSKSSDINEIYNENDLKNLNLEKIELYQKSLVIEMEREIEAIKNKYNQKLMKLNYVSEYLKKNPHLKNLKEAEEYDKFSKMMEKSVICSTKNTYDLSIGMSSFIPLNQIKVNNYKPNNISHLNSQIITEKTKKGYVKTKQKNFSAS